MNIYFEGHNTCDVFKNECAAIYLFFSLTAFDLLM